jgi:integrase
VARLRASGNKVPDDLKRAANLAARWPKGGQVGLNRFKARVRHLFNWAIAQGYRDDTPFKRQGANVIRLNGGAETARARRLQAGEEERLIAASRASFAGADRRGAVNGLPKGKLLSLQWRDVYVDDRGRFRWLVLQPSKTKTQEPRVVPIGLRLAAVLEMARHDPFGDEFGPDAYLFGNELGERIVSVKTAWRSACENAGIVDLRFHDLRREFACRLLESRAELHDVRDFLGHANITTTSRYRKSTPLRLERALNLLERADARTGATPVPQNASGDGPAASEENPQLGDVLEDDLVTLTFASWNGIGEWLRRLEALRRAA